MQHPLCQFVREGMVEGCSINDVEYALIKEACMGQALRTLGIDSMSVADRIALAQDIWDSVAIEAGLLPPGPSEKAEIDRRLAEDEAAPDDAISWDTIKSESQTRWKK